MTNKTAAQQARIDRAEDKAERLQAAGEAALNHARETGSMIPMGQPILVGHHSEKRHRRDLARIDATMRKGVDLLKAAEQATSSYVGSAVLSDDPEALQAMQAKLAKMEADREAMKAYNKAARKAGAPTHERYMLTNLGANIRRVKERIVELEALAELVDVEIEGEGFTYREDVEAVRVQIECDGKPGADERKVLKGRGFRWAPSVGVWQRQLNNGGRYAAVEVIKALWGVDLKAQVFPA